MNRNRSLLKPFLFSTSAAYLCCGGLLSISYCEAATSIFENTAGDNDWFTAGNWSTNAAPVSGDSVFIGGDYSVGFDFGTLATLNDLNVGFGSGTGFGTGTLNIGLAASLSTNDLYLGTDTNGTINLTGGSSLSSNGNLAFANTATGNATMNLSGSSSWNHSMTTNSYIGNNGGVVNWNITDGASSTIETNGKLLYLANSGNSVVNLTVDGAGSSLAMNDGGFLSFGSNTGTVDLTLSNGATMDVDGNEVIFYGDSVVNILSGSTFSTRGPYLYLEDKVAFTVDNSTLDIGSTELGIEDNALLKLTNGSVFNLVDGVTLSGKTGVTGLIVEGAGTTINGENAELALDVGDSYFSSGSKSYFRSTVIDKSAGNTLTITGNGTLLSTGEIDIGLSLSGANTVNVLDGGSLMVTNDFELGNSVGVAGNLNVSGVSSEGNASSVSIGGTLITDSFRSTDQGSIMVDQGGLLSVTGGMTSEGGVQMSITDSGSHFTVASDFYGDSGNLYLADGAGATFENLYMGTSQEEAFSFTMENTGAGDPTLRATSSMVLGGTFSSFGTGLTLQQSAGNVFVGDQDSAGLNNLANTNAIIGSSSSTASVLLRAASTWEMNNLYLGAHAGCSGEVTVQGANTSLVANQNAYFGTDGVNAGGTAAFTLKGGIFRVGDTDLGLSSGSAALVVGNSTAGGGGLYADNAASFDITGDVYVAGAASSQGEVNLAAGSIFNSTGSLNLASGSSSIANVNLDGSGTAWTHTGAASIANGGTANLSLSDTALFTINGDVSLGSQENTSGIFNVSGSRFSTNGTLNLGTASGANTIINLSGSDTLWTHTGGANFATNGGDVTINVLDGAEFDMGQDSNTIEVASGASSSFTLNVDGSGSIFEVGTQYFDFGHGGDVAITLSNGARWENNGSSSDGQEFGSSNSGSVNVQVLSGSTYKGYSSLEITKNTTFLIDDATLSVRSTDLKIKDNAVVTVQNGGSISGAGVDISGANASLILDGEGSRYNRAASNIELVQGNLIIRNGADVNFASIDVSGNGSNISVDGVGSSLVLETGVELNINSDTTASVLQVTDGGLMQLNGTSNTFYLSNESNNNIGAHVTVSGNDATLDIKGDLNTRAPNGAGSISVGDTGQLSVGGDLYLTDGATMSFDAAGTKVTIGGNLYADDNNGGNTIILSNGAAMTIAGELNIAEADSFQLLTGATLETMGVKGFLINESGVFSPGNSPASVIVDGDYMQLSDGILLLEIGGTSLGSEYDFLSVIGEMDLDGVVKVEFIDGYVPTGDYTFDLIDAGTFTDSGYVLELEDVSAYGYEWDSSSFGLTGELSLVATVPEPSAYLLMTFGVLSCCFLRRRNARA